MSADLFQTLNDRGYIYQMTHPEEVEALLNRSDPVTFYLGIDPTADSLHIGHFFALMMFRRLQQAGHHGILVIGGATALIGDPSGKSDMRKMLSKEQAQHNVDEVKELAKHFISTEGENPAIILNNADWFQGYDFVDFMRDIGVHFNVNVMLAADAYANRIKEGGLTFLEMGYMLMQSYDFVYLNRTYGCQLQIGGSDQWGNIVAGANLNRKLALTSGDASAAGVVGVTCPLLLTKEGKKMGKTESGALWVARDKTTPYDFYQYFYNVDDGDVGMLLKLFTYLDMDEIAALLDGDIIAAKRRMAFEVTKLVHGQAAADEAVQVASSLFSGQISTENMPEVTLAKDDFAFPVPAIDVMAKSGLFASKGDARRMIEQGGAYLNGTKIADIAAMVQESDLDEGSIVLRKGKKAYLKVVFA